MADLDGPYDITLLGLTTRSLSFAGHIEDMSGDERVFLLGAFAGGLLRLDELVLKLHEQGSDETKAALQQVLFAMGHR
jgi:hypothetical protein